METAEAQEADTSATAAGEVEPSGVANVVAAEEEEEPLLSAA